MLSAMTMVSEMVTSEARRPPRMPTMLVFTMSASPTTTTRIA